MVAADDAGALERAWICAGFRSLDTEDWEKPEVFDKRGERPVLMVTYTWSDRGDRDLAFGAGMAELFLMRHGWRAMVRVLVHLDDAVRFFEATGQEQSAD